MRHAAQHRSGATAAFLGMLALGLLLVVSSTPRDARGQLVAPEPEVTDIVSKAHDYFAQYSDPGTATLLHTVERYHLSESFWQYYREGEYNSARADLEYVLGYFPNHPKALHLIAYDENVKSTPSVVIQRFEFAIRSFPGHAYTYAQYGRYLASIGRRQAGMALLDEAVRLDPSLLVARAWLEERRGEGTRPATERPHDAARGKAPPPASNGPPARKP